MCMRPAIVAAFVSATLVLAVLAVPGANAENLDVSTASYLGGPGNDGAGGIDYAPDGSIVFGGALSGTPGGMDSTDLVGGGSGSIVRMNRRGTGVLSVTRIGEAIHDLQVGRDGRIVAAAQGVGPVVLGPDGRSVAWHKSLPNVRRVSVGQDGTVAALSVNSTDWVDHSWDLHVYSPTGEQIGHRRLGGLGNDGDRMVKDVAVDSINGRIVVTGWNNGTAPGRIGPNHPIQIPWIRGYSTDMQTLAWEDYNWPALYLNHNPQTIQDSEADSRAYRVTIGDDDKLYFLGEAAGGDSTFRYDPQQIDRFLPEDEWPRYDRWAYPWESASEPKSVFGRFDPASGKLEKIEWIFAREPVSYKPHARTLRARGIDADAEGRVYLTGWTTEAIKNRDLQKVAGEQVAPYAGPEAFATVISPDFSTREAWTVFSAGGDSLDSRGLAIAGADGEWALAGMVTSGELITTEDALQPVRLGGSDGYLLVVPEPATLAMLALCGLALATRRRSVCG